MSDKCFYLSLTKKVYQGGQAVAEANKRTKKEEWRAALFQLAVVILIVILVRTFVIGTIYVKGSSMEPNFHHGDFLLINKLEIRLQTPAYGEVVICRLEEGAYQENIIKRIVGLPEDVIDLRENGSGTYDLYRNGKLIEETYIAEPIHEKGNITYPYTVPVGQYFVMGDNRNASTDSRRTSVGCISKENLVGRVVMRLYPFDTFGVTI